MKHGQIPGILALLFVCAVAFIPAMAAAEAVPPLTNDTAMDYYNAAVTLTAQGDYAEAIDLYDLALASNTTMMNKTDALLYTYQGKSFSQIQLGNYTGAIVTLDTGLSAFPGDPLLWNNKGFAQYSLGQYADAVTSYDKAIAIDGNYTGALINKGDALAKQENYQDAATAYQTALAQNPADNETAAKLADVKNATASSPQSSQQDILIVLAIVVIIAAAGVAYYVTRKGTADDKKDEKPVEKKSEKKKSKK